MILSSTCFLRHLFLSVLVIRRAIGCTTLVVGRSATIDGSVLVTHSDDGESKNDARLCKVPARNHTPGSRRAVYFWNGDFPRYIGRDRCSIYFPESKQHMDEPIGFIPQVSHTYAYFDSSTGLLNEHGLAMGESTCSSVFVANASGHGGKALFTFDELSRIAMERTKTARAAVELMGSLAEKYGFYGAGTFEGSGESLLVGDPMEAFIFHILPDPSGESAIWAAQRVPEDHVGVVANMFVIREIDLNDSHNFLYSQSMLKVAIDRQWWTPGVKPFDFTRIYSDGEYAHKFYSGRRMWRAYQLFGATLPGDYEDLRFQPVYPASLRPSRMNITVKDLFAIHRDYYQGTKIDMTQGIAAGPWGSPDRWTTTSKLIEGNWERSIALFRTTSTHVIQSRTVGQGAMIWYGPHAAAGTCFMPMPATLIRVPKAYEVANPDVFDRTSAYWAHRFVFNLAQLKYSYAIQDVQALQTSLEEKAKQMVRGFDASCGATCNPERMASAYNAHSIVVLDSFWNLTNALVVKYADGYISDGPPLSYPDWWLRIVGYTRGPPPPPKSRGHSKLRDSCDDNSLACVNACPMDGFSRCAAQCLKSTQCVDFSEFDSLVI
eukprot:TRINITY_DN49691_c0_g1_i1.p1 TRINITY_DN49691_c0_g1~~TRINITY_DN49691_c0_g1_i1.p1  ORF type:complete len:617 (-),score=28.52 TRINITY_DN49691_c0_g1_i1:38-1849(-)